MSAFTTAMDTNYANKIVGEKGTPAHKTCGVATVDLFFKLVRDLSDTNLEALFKAAAKEATTPEAKADLVVLAFQTRNCRGGKGEKSLFYRLMTLLADSFGAETVEAVLPLVPDFGYYKDLLALSAVEGVPARVADKCLDLFAAALEADALELEKANAEQRMPKLSLAGKYAPRESGMYDRKLKLAAKLAVKLHGSAANKPAAQRKYRKLIASLNAALNTPEVLMAAGRYAEIKFGAVASLCLQRHRKAFLNELVKGKLTPSQELTGNRKPGDADRVAARANLRAAIAAKGVKGKQLMPHEIAARLMGARRGGVSTAERDLMAGQWAAVRAGVVEALAKAAEQRDLEVLDAAGPQAAAAAAGAGAAGALASVADLKKALPKTVDLGKLVALVDVSGSMGGQPMEVAIGLGILVSELAAPAFKDRVLTFETRPNWVDLTGCADIADKVSAVQSAGWGGSTDFEAACERILGVCESAKLTPDGVPDLLVLSDMQFDQAGGYGHYGPGYCRSYGGYYGNTPVPAGTGRSSWETAYERLERRFAEVGRKICGQAYAPPRIIFWNLRGNAVGFPVQADAPNTQMLSGFSPALLKLVLTGAELAAAEEEVVQADGSVRVKKAGPTPEQTLRAALDDSAYDAVRLKLSEMEEGVFKEYGFAREEAGFELVDVM